jgi:hypothetical protein
LPNPVVTTASILGCRRELSIRAAFPTHATCRSSTPQNRHNAQRSVGHSLGGRPPRLDHRNCARNRWLLVTYDVGAYRADEAQDSQSVAITSVYDGTSNLIALKYSGLFLPAANASIGRRHFIYTIEPPKR